MNTYGFLMNTHRTKMRLTLFYRAIGLCFAMLFVPAASFAADDVVVAKADLAPAMAAAESGVTPTSDAARNTPSTPNQPPAKLSRVQVLVASFTVFALAVIVGFEVIAKVPPTLHTPLMSGSNAISGITVVGAMIAAGHHMSGFASILGLLAVVAANINVVGGFLVTHRMLRMFKKR